MAYVAVISLKHTINGLLNSSSISLLSFTREILEFAYNQTAHLQQVLEKLNDSSRSRWERLDALEGQIRDCAHKLEDVLEFHELNSYEDEEVRQEITSHVENMEKMEKDYVEELSSPVPEDDDDDSVSSYVDFGVEMVGYSNQFTFIRNSLIRKIRPDDMFIYSFLGEIGSGRTNVANIIFQDVRKSRKQNFDCWAWVKIGATPELKEVLIRILAQVDNLAAGEYESLMSKEDDKLCKYLHKILEHRRYMIVLDDVRDVQVVDFLRSSFPDQSNGSVVFLTTSLKEVAQLGDSLITMEVPQRYFEETFWNTSRVVIFGMESISPELDQAGKKIIENCRCLFIAFVKTLLFLLKSEKTLEEWSKIAADTENPIFMVADEVSEVSKIKTEMQPNNWDMDDEVKEMTVELISGLINASDAVKDVKMKMHPERFFSKMQIISLIGMAGIGKTTFVKKIFKENLILDHFDHHVWITLGPKYQPEEILIDILVQIHPHIDKLHIKGDEKLTRELCVQLSYKRCLIVLDDLCSKEPLHHLKNLFPDIKGKALVTTRQGSLVKVVHFEVSDIGFEMRLLDEEESWCLLRRKVFAGGLCPPELEKVGREIAEKCDGLPLLILTVADQLLKIGISQEYWKDVASGKQKSVFMDAHHQISTTLLPSYQRLPQHLKACFLYVGVFREKYKIPKWELTNLLIAEGFLEPNSPQKIEDFVAECLSELIDTSFVLNWIEVSNYEVKKCRLHAVFWHLANSQAKKNKFFHAINSYEDCSIESIQSQRRLCIRNSILLGFKDVQDSMKSNTGAHSLLCVSPLEHYPVPLNFDMRLLKVMNVVTIRLYEFPIEVVGLVHLRYLGLTCNGKLPTSISNLWKLQYLIVKRYVHIKSSQNSLPLPEEIWVMNELKHLQVMGGCLPNHKSGSGLLNLSALLDVSAQSCREEVLKWIPNLKRLGIRIELVPDDQGDSFHYLNNIHHLCGLESLKCVVVNPQFRSEAVPPPAPISMFPASLKKLSLSGLGYPWEYMSTIIELENLEVLKLKCYAFQGPKWEMEAEHVCYLSKLKLLSVEGTNLVHWIINVPIATTLERLCIKHCYKLQELPIAFLIATLRQIAIFDCSPSTETWAEQMVQAIPSCQLTVHRSWIADTHRE